MAEACRIAEDLLASTNLSCHEMQHTTQCSQIVHHKSISHHCTFARTPSWLKLPFGVRHYKMPEPAVQVEVHARGECRFDQVGFNAHIQATEPVKRVSACLLVGKHWRVLSSEQLPSDLRSKQGMQGIQEKDKTTQTKSAGPFLFYFGITGTARAKFKQPALMPCIVEHDSRLPHPRTNLYLRTMSNMLRWLCDPALRACAI